jgi:hypothetical protein
MADNPNLRPQVMPACVEPHAPFIYFEIVPAIGHANGVFALTLTANRTYPGKDGAVINEQVAVAYLRGNAPAFMNLKQGIDNALLLAAPTQEGKAN